jgi:hypothetical protein
MFPVSPRRRVKVFAWEVRPSCNKLRGDYRLNQDSISWMLSHCSFDDPLPEPPLPGAPVPDRIFPTPTDVPVPEPFDVPAPSPVDVPVQTPQAIPAPPSEWPDDPALKYACHSLRRFDRLISASWNAARPTTLLSAGEPVAPARIRDVSHQLESAQRL